MKASVTELKKIREKYKIILEHEEEITYKPKQVVYKSEALKMKIADKNTLEAYIEFFKDEETNKIFCIFTQRCTGHSFIGKASCNPEDVPDDFIGIIISRNRAEQKFFEDGIETLLNLKLQQDMFWGGNINE